MLISLGAGVEIDILSSEEHHNSMSELRKSLNKTLSPDPSIYKTVTATGTYSQDPTILDLGAAPSGAMWVPLWLVVIGPTDSTAVANSMTAVYFGGSVDPVSSGSVSSGTSLSNLLIPASAATAIPWWTQLGGNDPLYGHAGDHLYCVIHGGIVFQTQITAIARVREVRPSAVAELNLL